MWIDDSGNRPKAPAPDWTEEQPARAGTAVEPEPTPAENRFRTCRWSVREDGPEYCSNPDVLPYAGKGGFNPEAWCLDCALYKLRRKAPKRRRVDDDYPY